jgi:hypothetical protein
MVRTRVSAARGFGIALAGMVFAAGGLAPTSAHAGPARRLARLSAKVTGIDGMVSDIPGTATPDGSGTPLVPLDSNTLRVPPESGDNVMYITIVGTAFSSGNGFALNCQLDGVNCLAGDGTQGDGSVLAIPTGWIIPLGNEFSNGPGFGDTGFSYQWCVPIEKKPKDHSVLINAGSAFGGETFLEAVQVFVDSNRISNSSDRCATYATPNGVVSGD